MKLSFRNRDEVLGLLEGLWREGGAVDAGRTLDAIVWRNGAWQLAICGGVVPLSVQLALADEAKPAFRRTRRFQISYGDIAGGATKADLALLEALVAHLQRAEGSIDDVDASAEPEAAPVARVVAEMTFSADGLAEFLSPEVRTDAPCVDRWRLVDIRHGTTALRQESVESYHLVFQADGSTETAMIAIGPLQSGGAFREVTPHFVLWTFGHWLPDGRDGDVALASPLFHFIVGVVRAKDTPSLHVHPDPGSSILLSRRGVAQDQARELNLGVRTPCHQSCVYCSLMAMNPPRDDGEEMLAKFKVQLLEARELGIRRMRLNGIDPLTFSKLWDLLALIRELGFTSIDTFTTARPFADPAFCDRFLAAQPEEFSVNVPIYGLTAAEHEAVTRAPGSFAEMWQGLHNLLERCGPEHIELESVVVRQNLPSLPALARYAHEHKLAFMAHLAFPMSGSRQDPYLDSVVSLREIVETVSRDGPPEYVHGIHPCVAFWVEQELGQPAFAWWNYEADPPLQGTEYAKSTDRYANLDRADQLASVASYQCPHAHGCALAAYCPKSMYRLYVERFGWGEFRPVRLEDLARARLQSRP